MMGAVTIAPSDEACQALVAWINSGITYTLLTPATYSYKSYEELSEVTQLDVHVTHAQQKQMKDTLDVENRSSHTIIVWVRDKLLSQDVTEIASRNLIVRKIFQRLNNFRSANKRIKVRECADDDVETHDKEKVQEQLLFKAGITLRVEVDAP